MKGYEAKDLEQLFKKAGRIRRNKKEFSNDSDYWLGGSCNWGGNHNLREDCETIASSFAKIENLKEIKKELKECTGETEFNSKKRDFLDTINQSANGLRPRTGHSSSMFGVCIIWADEAMSPNVEKCIEGCKKEVEKIKSALEKETYKWVEEIRQLKLEINQIEARMKENKRKAMSEKDPNQRAILLQLIEEDGELLQQKYKEQQRLENKFNFDPARKVQDMVEAMKKAIEGKGGSSGGSGNNSGGNGSGRNKDKNKNGSDGNGGGGDDDKDPKPPRRKKEEKKDKDNSQMLFIAIAVIVILFLMTNQPKPQREEDYEYYY